MEFKKYNDPPFLLLIVIIIANILFQLFFVLNIVYSDLRNMIIHPIFIVFEMLWVFLTFLMLRSLWKKTTELKMETTVKNEAMSIYTKQCPECKVDLEDFEFESKKGIVWKVGYCPQCQKAVYKRSVNDVSSEPPDISTTNIAP